MRSFYTLIEFSKLTVKQVIEVMKGGNWDHLIFTVDLMKAFS